MKHLKLIAISSILTAGLLLHAPTDNKIPLEILFSNSEVLEVQLAPDGSHISYLKPDKNNKLQIWIATPDKNNEVKITNDNNRSIRQYFWQHDCKHILYFQDNDGDENWNLYQTNITSKKTICLTPFSNIHVKVVYYSKHHPDTIIIAMNKENKEKHDLYSLSLKNQSITLIENNPSSANRWLIGHDLKTICAEVIHEDGSKSLLQKNNNQWESIFNWNFEDSSTSNHLFFSKDNQYLYLLDSTNANSSQLVKFNFKTKQKEIVASDPIYDISSTLIYDPNTYHIQAIQVEKERNSWLLLDQSIKKDLEVIKNLHHGDFEIESQTNDNKLWIIAFNQDIGPKAYYLYNRTTQQATFLFYNKSQLLNYTLLPMLSISFQAQDNLTLHGYLTIPQSNSKEKVPMILFVHGGPWSRDSWGFNPLVQWFANKGYACLQINFRGSTGYGKNLLNAGNKEWGKKMLDDLIDGVQWSIKHHNIDPKRVAIFGGSYGGYAALAAATFTKDIFTCAVDIVGISNIITLLQSIPPYWSAYKAIFNKRVGNPDTEEDYLKTVSPLFHVDKIQIPLFIAQGANDPRVPQAQSDTIVKLLKEKNIPHEYMVFSNEGHGFINQENRFDCYHAIEKFLQNYL